MNFAIPSATTDSAAQTSAAAGGSDARHRKLADAAQQFEGMLLQELLKPMREHSFGTGETEGGDTERDSGSDTLGSYASESLATALARSGGMGIAKQVIAQVDRQSAAQSATHDTHK